MIHSLCEHRELWLFLSGPFKYSCASAYVREALIPLKNVSRVNLILNIIKNSIVSVCNDASALLLEGIEIVDDERSEGQVPLARNKC